MCYTLTLAAVCTCTHTLQCSPSAVATHCLRRNASHRLPTVQVSYPSQADVTLRKTLTRGLALALAPMFLHCGTNDAARSVSALGALEDSYEAAHSVFESSVSALARSDATVADGTCAALMADGSAALELIANPENHDEVHDGTAEFVAPIVSHVVHSLPLQTEEVVRNAQENATETLADGGSDDSDLAGTAASDRQPECYVPTDTPNRIDTQAWQAHPTCNREQQHATYCMQHATYRMQHTACTCNTQHGTHTRCGA